MNVPIIVITPQFDNEYNLKKNTLTKWINAYLYKIFIYLLFYCMKYNTDSIMALEIDVCFVGFLYRLFKFLNKKTIVLLFYVIKNVNKPEGENNRWFILVEFLLVAILFLLQHYCYCLSFLNSCWKFNQSIFVLKTHF